MKLDSRTAGAIALAVFVLIGGAFFAMRPGPEPAAAPTGTPLSPPPFEEGSPAGALHAYLEGDFAGERLERASWEKYRHLVLWGSEPKWDGAFVIRSFRVESGKLDAKRVNATAESTFDTLGELDLDSFKYTTSPSRQTVPYQLAMGKDGWLIGAPILRPHVGPEAAIAFLKRMEVGYPKLKATIEASIQRIDADARAGKP